MPRTATAPAALAALVALAVAPAAPAATAKKGSVAGKLGVSVPKGAQANLRVINRADGTIVAVRPVKRSGSFSLTLPAGSYVIVGTVVPRPSRRYKRGEKRARITQVRMGVTLKAGQKRSKVNVKKAKRKAKKRRKAKRARARVAYVQELGQVTPGRVAVAIPDFTGNASGEFGAVMRGVNDVVTTDVVSKGADECDLAVIETDRRADAIKELEFQKSRYVDPSTRLTRNFIIDDVTVRGTMNDAPGGKATVDVRIVDSRSGKEYARLTETLSPDDFFDKLEKLAGRAVDELCKLREAYEVTLDVTGEGRFATHAASGTLKSTLLARVVDRKRPVWRDSGPLQWQNVSLTTKIPPCVYIDPVVPNTSWSVTILDSGGGSLLVTWAMQGPDATTVSVDCPPDGPDSPDPPPIPGQPGPSLVNTGPASFEVPYTGGTQAITGIIADGGDGFFNTGTIKVTPKGVTPSN